MNDMKKESNKEKRKRGITLKWKERERKRKNGTWGTVMMMTGFEGF
jgi:hypothetical protein